MINVLEHLPDAVRAVEEVHRIARPACKVTIRVPYWNSPDMITDPTHKVFFNEHSFDFFDPTRGHCQERPYYTTARFKIIRASFYVRFMGRYLKISNTVLTRALALLARYLGGVIWVEEFEMMALKQTT